MHEYAHSVLKGLNNVAPTQVPERTTFECEARHGCQAQIIRKRGVKITDGHYNTSNPTPKKRKNKFDSPKTELSKTTTQYPFPQA
jgi:hypothetical protein